MNYRIEGLTIDEIDRKLELASFKELLHQYDQLNREKNNKNCEYVEYFDGLMEGEILFWPTYKYDPGTDRWDTSIKKRLPAWCDRILYHYGTQCKNSIHHNDQIRLIAYRSHPEIRVSDHKPVSGLFQIVCTLMYQSPDNNKSENNNNLSLSLSNKRRQQKNQIQIQNRLPLLSTKQSKFTIDPIKIDFGNIFFNDHYLKRSLEFENVVVERKGQHIQQSALIKFKYNYNLLLLLFILLSNLSNNYNNSFLI